MEQPKFKVTFFSAHGALRTEKNPATLLLTKHTVLENLDMSDFTQKLQSQYESMDRDGFDVVNVIPIGLEQTIEISATSSVRPTRGAVVVGKRR